MKCIRKIIGENLKLLRYKSGKSQEKFYEEYKLSSKYYACIERGEINMTIDFLEKLAKTLHVDISEFFNRDETRFVDKKRIDEKEKEECLN